MIIKDVIKTCDACPSQWEAKTEDGRPVYIRYRCGHLTVRVGRSQDESVPYIISHYEPVFFGQIGGNFDGYLTDLEMRDLVNLITEDVTQEPV